MASILHVTQVPDKGIYKVILYWAAVDPQDTRLVKAFGEPPLDLGGSFHDPSDVAFTWTEPSKVVPVYSWQQRIEKVYDSTTDPYAEKKARIWAAEIRSRIQSALVSVRSKTDQFSSETDFTI